MVAPARLLGGSVHGADDHRKLGLVGGHIGGTLDPGCAHQCANRDFDDLDRLRDRTKVATTTGNARALALDEVPAPEASDGPTGRLCRGVRPPGALKTGAAGRFSRRAGIGVCQR